MRPHGAGFHFIQKSGRSNGAPFLGGSDFADLTDGRFRIQAKEFSQRVQCSVDNSLTTIDPCLKKRKNAPTLDFSGVRASPDFFNCGYGFLGVYPRFQPEWTAKVCSACDESRSHSEISKNSVTSSRKITTPIAFFEKKRKHNTPCGM